MEIKINTYSPKKVIFTGLTAATLSLYLGSGNLNTVNAESLTSKPSASFKNAKIKKKASLVNKEIRNAVTVESESTERKTDSKLLRTVSDNSDSAQTCSEDKQVQASMQENSNYDITELAEELPPKDQLPKIEPRSVIKAKWSGLEVAFDNGLLIVPGGAVINPSRFSSSFKNINAKEEITKIKFIGALSITGSADYLFDSLENLTEIEGMQNLFTSGVTSMKFMFSRCGKLTALDLSSFDTSEVKNMARMFLSDSKLEKINLDVSKFNTAKVVDTWGMFGGCESLKDIDVSHFETAQVKNMNGMFLKCSSLTSIDVRHFNTDSVTNMLGMFWQCTNLESLDLSNFNMTASTINNNMLKDLTKLNTLILGKNNYLIGTELDTPGIWQSVDKDTPVRKWNSADLTTNYNGATDYGTYERFISVLAHYQDKENKAVAPDDTLTGKIGDPYPDKPLTGYVQVKKPDGQFSDSKTEVIYYYTNQVAITAHYVDQEGNKLADDATLTGKIGDPYPDKKIAGYVLKSRSSDKFSDSSTEVIYVYARAAVPSPEQIAQVAAVTVHYQDVEGNMLAPDEILYGKVGAGYVSVAKTIAGYKMVTRPKNATGFFSQNPQSLTYIYAPLESTSGKHTGQNSSGSGTGSNSKSQTTDHSKGRRSHASRNNKQMLNGKTGQEHKATAAGKKNGVTKGPESRKQLPQTGTADRERAAAWLLGSLSVLSGLIGIWINRRKKKD